MTQTKTGNVKNTPTKTSKPSENFVSVKDFSVLQDTIKKQQDLINSLLLKISNVSESDNSRLMEDDDVRVISLRNEVLNLSTGGKGDINHYTFNHFGEEQMIPFKDVKFILIHNKSFFENGYFDVDESLPDMEKHISKNCKSRPRADVLVNLLDKDKDTFIKVFKLMSNGQKESFSSLIVDKIYKGEDIDYNIVKFCGDDLGRDLAKEAENRKKIFEEE